LFLFSTRTVFSQYIDELGTWLFDKEWVYCRSVGGERGMVSVSVDRQLQGALVASRHSPVLSYTSPAKHNKPESPNSNHAASLLPGEGKTQPAASIMSLTVYLSQHTNGNKLCISVDN